jgi:hypothetical protein
MMHSGMACALASKHIPIGIGRPNFHTDANELADVIKSRSRSALARRGDDASSSVTLNGVNTFHD